MAQSLSVKRKFLFMCSPAWWVCSLVLITSFITFNAVGQDVKKMWTAGINAGMIGFSPSPMSIDSGSAYFTRTRNPAFGLSQVEDVKGRKSVALAANTSWGLNAGLLFRDGKGKNYTGLQVEMQANKACYSFNVPFTWATASDSFGSWVMTDKYYKYSIALQQCFYMSDYSWLGGAKYCYLRGSFGQTFYHRNFTDPIVLGHSEDWTLNGTGMITKTIQFSKTSYMITAEIGLKSFNEDQSKAVDLGFVYYAPFNNTYTESYEFFQQGTSVGKSRIIFQGGTFMFNLRYTFNGEIKDRPKRPVDSTKINHRKDEIVKNEEKRKVKILGRDLDIQQKVNVAGDSVVVEVWDKGIIDGDRIALYLNGELIADNITLTKDKQKVVLHLLPGKNYLVMHALNLGSIPPNTAAIDINGGEVKTTADISSDVSKSGAIEITYTPK